MQFNITTKIMGKINLRNRLQKRPKFLPYIILDFLIQFNTRCGFKKNKNVDGYNVKCIKGIIKIKTSIITVIYSTLSYYFTQETRLYLSGFN